MRFVALAILLALGLGHSASAQTATVLNIPDIQGESNLFGYEDQIDVLNWSQSVSNVAGMPVVLPLEFFHQVDKASPKLVEATLAGTDLGTVVLSVLRTGAQGVSEYITIKLNQAKIVAVKTSGSDSGTTLPASEVVTMSCGSFVMIYRPIENDGSPGPSVETMGSCGN